MKIISLVDNKAASSHLKANHGLSLYVETTNHKILIDLGQNDLFIKNANKLGVDIFSVDTVIITHGHMDHGGGLKTFLDKNTHAKVYINENAFHSYYAKLSFLKIKIGLDKAYKFHPQIILIKDDFILDQEIRLISNPLGKSLLPNNHNLYDKINREYIYDQFQHEQSVLITEEKTVLIAGCAHRGIINIIQDAELKGKKKLDFCIGGFHLMSPGKKFNQLFIDELTKELLKTNLTFYTCHCTGTKAYEKIKEKMGEKIFYLAAGDTILIDHATK